MVRSLWMGAVVGALAWTGLAWSQKPGAEQILVVHENGRPAQKCKVLRTWVARDGSRMQEVQALDTGEKMTIQEPTPGRRGTPRRVFPWGRSTTPPPGVPTPPPGSSPPAPPDAGRLAPVPQTAPPRSPYALRPVNVPPRPTASAPAAPAGEQHDSLLKRIFLPSPPAPAAPQGRPAEPKGAGGAVPYPLVKVEPSSATPRDWRESWGKVDRHSYAKETKPAVRPAALTKAPRPDDRKDDRPQNPSPDTRTKVEADPSPAALGMGSIVAVRSPLLKEDLAAGSTSLTPAANAFTEVQAEAQPPAAPGAGPMPYPAVPGRYPMPGPVHAPAGPVVAMDQGVPAGLANAFTAGGTTRPIPADFGPPAHPDNAFGDPTGGMTAAAMMPPAPPGPVMVYTPQGLVMVGPPGAYPQGMPVPAQQAGMASASGGAQTRRLLATLKDAALPSEREMAVEQLSGCDWRAQPQVVQALLSAAREDPAPLVRAGCVRALGRMKVNTVPVYQAVQGLKDDPDLRVRREAEQTLGLMAGR